ncbi:bifunctional proline dehydrogenase/L-glutamate gamma-semialdehyde dehydrogenase PutA [Haematospirillum jordaniae]|uniref:bifunctional proline dehydrogenase/L-glutamate gamma-semialdehyde dehydrogenase PutA n=1 Tax=Haematospirillum jordaniae TaxID=1549855 RepID=UPI001432DA23|nr:bifunctional proline dehydrogenase/L-glutamate gamma-semialdehyde dehydrogenase PutA [Haematospirillum jordaniae]NKD85726.1 bifunctional proline dehydrogenase/L-glutamate gamma-semialdehyde dehydrogenase PutA [Haematospirillum jordaniae]
MPAQFPLVFPPESPDFPAWCDRLAVQYRRDEDELVVELIEAASCPREEQDRVDAMATRLVSAVRSHRVAKGGVDAFMHEYDLSTREGLTLMCLAEAMLRIPDPLTVDALVQDRLCGTDWDRHFGNSRSLFVNAATLGLMVTGRILQPSDLPGADGMRIVRSLVARLGQPVIRQALRQAMKMMGRQFVLGRTIEEARKRGAAQERRGYRYSFDMLGESARTESDARAYFVAYEQAIHAIGQASNGRGVLAGPGISVKLSALHPRYEAAKRADMLEILAGRTLTLARLARQYDIGFCIDAEEADRLELSLEIIQRVYSDPSLDGWTGFGLAVQAYQKRTRVTLEILADMVRAVGRRMNIRLVKGAYWDTEIKRAQETGLADYPVYTRKVTTDVSYLSCARALFGYGDLFFPQFATHNAQTMAAVLEMAAGRPFEFQRLHGMGEELYEEIVPADKLGIPCRIYAPVGSHAELLSYLVRRLLENGANTSFVNRLVDERIPVSAIIANPVDALRPMAVRRHPGIPLPRDLYGSGRINASGMDLSDSRVLSDLAEAMKTHAAKTLAAGPLVGGEVRNGTPCPVYSPADRHHVVGTVSDAGDQDIRDALGKAKASFAAWSQRPVVERAAILRRAADLMEQNMALLMTLCIREAGKTLPDAVSEVREAVDFLRYYAAEALRLADDHALTGRGVFLCISPWNFPLAIFVGQVSAALVAGNTVVAKPAEQTPLVAFQAVRLLHEAGIPVDSLSLLPGRGETVGAALVSDPDIAGVAFTGSSDVARLIARSLAARGVGPVPLIAETGGMNAMIVDSSALPEQVVRDVLLSAFGSAGQRCSALRVLYVQDDIADTVLAMLRGAMSAVRVGHPGRIDTDVGPVIDEEARSVLERHARALEAAGRTATLCPLAAGTDHGVFFAPRLFEIESIRELSREVFGPILHVIRYKAADLDRVLADIRDTGYGLTMGVHTRIESRAQHVFQNSRVGNLYVNRSMTGAVVGVQPFGGEGLSGTGPKAGGPYYLPRFARSYPFPASAPAVGDPATVVTHATPASVPAPMSEVQAPASAIVRAMAVAMREGSASKPEFTSLDKRVAVLESMVSTLQHQGAQILALLERDCGAERVPTPLAAYAAILRQVTLQVRALLSGPARMPGPTGETNELHLAGRGPVVLFMDQDASLEQGLAMVAAAYGAGNPVTMVVHSSLAAAVRCIVPQAVGLELVVATPSDSLAALADLHDVGAVGVSGGRGLLDQVARVVAARDGAVVPVVDDEAGPGLVLRFCCERTLTVDITAAGGNTLLMMLGDAAS